MFTVVSEERAATMFRVYPFRVEYTSSHPRRQQSSRYENITKGLREIVWRMEVGFIVLVLVCCGVELSGSPTVFMVYRWQE
jgi:hypothetical protein